jgi:putative toxin-antitoxin system antitoxin component (TIGR02293 family)
LETNVFVMSVISTLSIEKKINQEISSLYKGIARQENLDVPKSGITLTDFLADKMLVVSAIRQGVPYSLFHVIQEYAPFSEGDWADLLDLSTKSLQRYKQNARHFGPLQSEKIIEVSEVTSLGLEVFGSMDKLKLWLHTPSYALGKLPPVELLKDSYGKELVVAELTRINHGILS